MAPEDASTIIFSLPLCNGASGMQQGLCFLTYF